MFELTPFVKRNAVYDPFKEFDDMEKHFFGGAASFHADVRDTGEAYVIEAELPGFRKEDINVSVEADVLTVTATRKEETCDKKDGYVRRERSYGSFSRSFDVSQVESDQITGSLKDGILTLQLPKRHKAAGAVHKVELQ